MPASRPILALSPTSTMAELLETYEAEYVPYQAPMTRKAKHNFFVRVRKTDLAAVRLCDLTPEVLRQWWRPMHQEVSGGTLCQYMRMLSAPLTVAVRDYEILAQNPMAKVRKPPAGRGRLRFLDTEEQGRLLAACQQSRDEKLYYLVLLALSTGARKRELLMLHWTHLDLTHGRMILEQTKNGEGRMVPVPQRAREALSHWRAQCPGAWVFPGAHGAIPADIGRQWGYALHRAGIAQCTFHGLRHTFATNMGESGARIEDIKELLGHRSLASTMIYRHTTQGYMADLVERMAAQFIHPH